MESSREQSRSPPHGNAAGCLAPQNSPPCPGRIGLPTWAGPSSHVEMSRVSSLIPPCPSLHGPLVPPIGSMSSAAPLASAISWTPTFTRRHHGACDSTRLSGASFANRARQSAIRRFESLDSQFLGHLVCGRLVFGASGSLLQGMNSRTPIPGEVQVRRCRSRQELGQQEANRVSR